MADRMEFPKTMQEFVESYSFIDIDEVYTNGCMLLPTFRVEQAIEHYEKEIRAKAIDETCLKIFNHLLSEIEWNRVLVDDWDALAEEFKEIAEKLKGGAE